MFLLCRPGGEARASGAPPLPICIPFWLLRSTITVARIAVRGRYSSNRSICTASESGISSLVYLVTHLDSY